VLDDEDFYPNISLGGRLDTDGDGIPNDCDAECILTGMTADIDDDGDGYIDTADNCPLIANPDQLDDNNDGIGNLCQPPGCA
jgi:thrombospondin 2/3/4/5